MDYFFKKKQVFENLKVIVISVATVFVVAFIVREYYHDKLYREVTQRAYVLDPQRS